jgi:hypothetical protein
LTFLDTGGAGIATVFSNGSSNSIIGVRVPGHFVITMVGINATQYALTGFVASGTTPDINNQ